MELNLTNQVLKPYIKEDKSHNLKEDTRYK